MNFSKVLIISTADWDHPLQTNKQHVARSLASMGLQILYVETLGLRPITQREIGDGARIARRLKNAFRGPHQRASNISVVSPLVLPNWGSGIVRSVNRLALGVQTSLWMLAWGRPDLVISYSPVGAVVLTPFVVGLKKDRMKVVYHCVDDIAAQPGMPSGVIERFEGSLIKKVDGVVTTSKRLAERATALGASRVLEQTNVVDYERFAPARETTARRHDGVVVGFVGALSEYKVNMAWVEKAAQLRPDLEFRLYGPQDETSLKGSAGAIPENIRFMGPLGSDDVPLAMAEFDAAIIPAPFNRYTESMFPMKFFEYMAAGVPVVASNLSSLRAFRDSAILVNDFDGFLAGIDSALAGGGPSREARLATAEMHTYEVRTREMLIEIESW
ncbi:glycosyltransferase [Curtobacterium sp. MCLR17_058]|uniref:glycosyltransferase n=1 Tax=Curtobacterium sp. MCLR17_058 TaxID=2175635 RepID=UPI0011B7CFD6|nr:glycosyltransferase [Curtobacterium sp. MCLR17_058]WIB43281.1 glycosyltransferase [Curtobacterium sp. MCLR17_058]